MRFVLAPLLALTATAQVYSPKLVRDGQPDSTDLHRFAQTIVENAHAVTRRQKAEAIWRFFLTDGRYVKPGFFYHIAGWAYEEPGGEVLDPIKLLNSYGFGLCYHIAPLLQAVYTAAGFEDARVWFLTGHTVAEVFYDGGYHYFDSDMMGYNVAGLGSFHGKAVASVHDIELHPDIMTGKLLQPGVVRQGTVDYPWYPADVHAHAIGELANLFSTTADNSLYAFTRYQSGHAMDFRLRKGESMTRFFQPEEPKLYYLPYKFDGRTWSEFPQDSPEFHIRTADGPRSQKDERTWATGRIDYDAPAPGSNATETIDMPCPYVIIDANFTMQASIADGGISVATSIDDGAHWTEAGALQGPHEGPWRIEPKVIARTANGRFTAVSGTYGYKVRITTHGARISNLHLTTRFEVNPRSLPAVEAGNNSFHFSSGAPMARVEIAAPSAQSSTFLQSNVSGQEFHYPEPGKKAEAVYVLKQGDSQITGFDFGVRLLDMRDGRGPDKLTAEVRQTSIHTSAGPASISWSTSKSGLYKQIWRYNDQPQWRDGHPISRLLRWPEVFKQIRDLPDGTKRVYIKIESGGPGFDAVRCAAYVKAAGASGQLRITQRWHEGSIAREHTQNVDAGANEADFSIAAGTDVRNDSITFALR